MAEPSELPITPAQAHLLRELHDAADTASARVSLALDAIVRGHALGAIDVLGLGGTKDAPTLTYRERSA